MTRWLKITAPLAVLAVLTGGCGLIWDSAPRVSGDDAPDLDTVWQAESDHWQLFDSKVAGNIVVAHEGIQDMLGDEHGSAGPVLIDGTSGRITGRPDTSCDLRAATVHPTTDERGRPLVAAEKAPNDEDDDDCDPTVYAPDGHVVWAGEEDERYAGGYVASLRKSGGHLRQVIHTPSGHVVARLALPGHDGSGTEPDLQVVRPGLLAAVADSQVALVDVSRPRHADVRMLRTPDKPERLDGVRVAVANGHLYAVWSVQGSAAHLARYDIPGTRPTWQRLALDGADGTVGIRANPGRNGADTVAVTVDSAPPDIPNGSETEHRYWLLRPDTGATIAPSRGWDGRIIGMSGGRVYAWNSGVDVGTDVVDSRTGTKWTIDDLIYGVTSKGYLISGTKSVDAYQWD